MLWPVAFYPAKGQSIVRLTLDECIDRAFAESPQLKLANLQIQKDFTEYNIKRKFLIPEIDAYARYFQYLDDRPVFIFPENSNTDLSNAVQLGAPQNFYSGVTVNQHLFDARMIGGRNLSEQFNALQATREEVSKDEIYFEVVKTFYQAQIIKESRDILTFNRDRMMQLENITRTAVENEAALASALDEFLLRKEELDIQEEDLLNKSMSLMNYMKFLVGLPLSTNLELLTTGSPLPEKVVVPDSSSSKAMEALELQIQLMDGELRQETFSSYPSLDLFMAFQWLQQEGYGELFSSDASWFNQHIIGLQLSIPILNPVSRKNQQQKVQIDRDIIRTQQDLLAEKNRMEQDDTYRAMILAGKKTDLAARKVDVYQKIFQQESIRYEQAFSSLQKLLEAEEQYRRAQIELAKSKSEYFISILELYEAYGSVRSFTEQR
jgi:outer membrane protein TolC